MENKKIGNYEIKEIIHKGSFGNINFGIHAYLKNNVAIKEIKFDSNKFPDFLQKFISRAHILKNLSHPNIASIIDYLLLENSLFIVYNYFDGISLTDYLSKYGRISSENSKSILIKLLKAFHYASSNNILYRNLKLSKILLDNNFEPKIIDFGIADLLRLLKNEDYLITAILEKKYNYYNSPEEFTDNIFDEKSLIYSLGIIFFEMLTGFSPYKYIREKTDSEYLLLDEIVRGPKILIYDFLPETPYNIDLIIQKATAKNPENRYQNLNEMILDLESSNIPKSKSSTNILSKGNELNYKQPINMESSRKVSRETTATDLPIFPPILASPQSQSIESEFNPEIGKIDYYIPDSMFRKKTERCKIRISTNELNEELLKICKESKTENVRISDLMSVYLIDPSGMNFKIKAISTTEQIISKNEYTEWLFDVTPLLKGEHPLLLKVTITEMLNKFGAKKKDVSVLEKTVTVKSGERKFTPVKLSIIFACVIILLFIFVLNNKKYFPFIFKNESVINTTGYNENNDLKLKNRGGEPVVISTDSMTVGGYFALIIGVGDYLNYPKLPNPVRDAESIAKLLEEKYLFSSHNIKILRDPDRLQILDALDTLENILDSTNNLLIFFAGHGNFEDDKKLGYWLAKDSEKNRRGTWIFNSDMQNYLRRIKAGHTLLITDACFAGSIFDNSRDILKDSDPSIKNKYKLKSRTAMTSGYLQKVSDESVFVKYLLKYLNENDKKWLLTSELYINLLKAVSRNSQTTPIYKDIFQTGDEGGDFIFIKK